MALLLSLLAGILFVTIALALPGLRQWRAARLLRAQQRAYNRQFLATLPPERMARHKAHLEAQKKADRAGNRALQLIYLLQGAACLGYFYVFFWLDDLAARLITSRAQELRIMRISLLECALMLLAGILWLQLKNRKPRSFVDRLKRIGIDCFGMLPVIFFTGVPLYSATCVVLFHVATKPETIAGTVTRAGLRHVGKVTNAYYADIAPLDGSDEVTARSYRSIHSWLTGYTVLVNRECAIQDLPVGLPVVLHGRRSEFGFALDEITSTASCSHGGGT
ncbi:hypothetical protein [Paraburkholderia acidicola]|nr:hypothetical protein [Paraburkholderia acidicola]